MAKRTRKLAPPVLRSVKSLVDGPLPSGPVILHIEKSQMERIARKAQSFRGRVRPGTMGVLVTPDPFGNFLGFLVCAGKSGPGNACIPLLKRSLGAVTFGDRCLCIRGKDPVEREPEAGCVLRFDRINGFTCTGGCTGGKTCKLMKAAVTVNGNPGFLHWCECS